MKTAIGYPAMLPGVKRDLLLDWAKQADAGPFSSLALIDRVTYNNYEPLIALAAAAAVTNRVRLMTSVLLGPTRNTGILAKQAATLDNFSNGRFTLGIAVGGRETDYQGAPANFHNRGRRFAEQLATMRRIWSGQGPAEGVPPIGPAPARAGGPEVLLGGFSPVAAQRVGKHADGFLGGGAPDQVKGLYEVAQKSWREAGRPGQPRLVVAAYYALGDAATLERGRDYLRDYYSFMGAAGADGVAQFLLASPDAVKGAMQAFSAIGADEMIFWATVPDIDQLRRLAQLAG